jgi:hypothetical protein
LGDRRPQNGVQFLDVGSLSQIVGQVALSLLMTVQEVQKFANGDGSKLGLGSLVDDPARLRSRGETSLETADVGPSPFC